MFRKFLIENLIIVYVLSWKIVEKNLTTIVAYNFVMQLVRG